MKNVKRMVTGTYGMKNFRHRVMRSVRKFFSEKFKSLFSGFEGHFLEYGLLMIVVIFGMIYFSYGSFQDYSFGFGDQYVHSKWVYGLVQGQPFSSGVYPEGMHCVIYALHVLFGIEQYSIQLFIAGILSSVFLIAAYVFFREVFRWRYSAIWALTLFLTIDAQCVNTFFSMSRLQWTLPLEFGLFTVFLSAASLIRYLKHNPVEIEMKPKEKKFLKPFRILLADENLLIFCMAIGAGIAIHFYTTIMAFFLCVAFVPMAVWKIFKPKRLGALVFSVVLACIVSIAPMAAALATGIPFEKSINWAVSVMNGDEGAEEGVFEGDFNSDSEQWNNDSEQWNNENGETHQESGRAPLMPTKTNTLLSQGNMVGSGSASEDAVDTSVEDESAEKVSSAHGMQLLKEKYHAFLDGSYHTLYRAGRVKLFLSFVVLSFVIFICFRIGATIIGIRQQESEICSRYDTYFGMLLASQIFMGIYAASEMGLPALIAPSRVCSMVQFMLMGMLVIPFDALISLLSGMMPKAASLVLCTVLVFGTYAGMRASGNFHGYLYFELTRHNGAVMATHSIVKNLPENSFTIVSPVDELYQLIERGYHEELVLFVNKCIESEYSIPTEYVFLFVEKRPLLYAQRHFFCGPDWLAEEKYADYLPDISSQCPNITAGMISEKLAGRPFFRYPITSASYSDIVARIVLESRLESWCQQFSRLYPGELHTYYEDDDFVCYYFKQNPASLYQLGFDLDVDVDAEAGSDTGANADVNTDEQAEATEQE